MAVKKYPPLRKQIDDIFNKEVPQSIGRAVRYIALETFLRVVQRSPVGNPDLWKGNAPEGYVGGRFRSNWQVAVGVRPTGVKDNSQSGVGQGSPASGQLVSEALGALAPLRQQPAKTYIVNNLPYAEELENGHSTQAPGGMVAVTVAELRSFSRELIARNI